jgi:hypothetical protein
MVRKVIVLGGGNAGLTLSAFIYGSTAGGCVDSSMVVVASSYGDSGTEETRYDFPE